MRLSQIKEYVKFAQAIEDGKTVQYRTSSDDTWIDWDNTWDLEEQEWIYSEHRIKPTQTYRPWKPEEVPFGIIFKHKYFAKGCWTIALGVGSSAVDIPSWNSAERSHIECVTFETLLKMWQYSTDNGKTWLPCGVLE